MAIHTDVPGRKPERTSRYAAALQIDEDAVYFHKTVTLTSAAAATAVTVLEDKEVAAGKKVYLQGFLGKVDGGTGWGTTATVTLQDSAATALVTVAVAALTSNAVVVPGQANVTLSDPFAKGLGGTSGKGLQLLGNANGTGSDLKLTVWGVIR